MKENVVLEKSYSFAVNTIIAVRSLNKTIDTYVLVKQLLRAGTSVGAYRRVSGRIFKERF